MASPRFFADGPFGGDFLPLSAEDVHHASTVLRLHPGGEIAIADADGVAHIVVLDAVGRTGLSGSIVRTVHRPPLARVTLVTALGKADKTDLVVEKAVEIGVERVVVLQTERSVVRLDGSRLAKRFQRLQRIAESAARQSQRFEVPLVEGPLSIAAFAAMIPSFHRVLVAWEEYRGVGIDAALGGCPPDVRVAIVVGAEGGLSAAEVAQLVDAGATPISLGTTILRTETAAIVATALVSSVLGGLGMTGRD